MCFIFELTLTLVFLNEAERWSIGRLIFFKFSWCCRYCHYLLFMPPRSI